MNQHLPAGRWSERREEADKTGDLEDDSAPDPCRDLIPLWGEQKNNLLCQMRKV